MFLIMSYSNNYKKKSVGFKYALKETCTSKLANLLQGVKQNLDNARRNVHSSEVWGTLKKANSDFRKCLTCWSITVMENLTSH